MNEKSNIAAQKVNSKGMMSNMKHYKNVTNFLKNVLQPQYINGDNRTKALVSGAIGKLSAALKTISNSGKDAAEMISDGLMTKLSGKSDTIISSVLDDNYDLSFNLDEDFNLDLKINIPMGSEGPLNYGQQSEPLDMMAVTPDEFVNEISNNAIGGEPNNIVAEMNIWKKKGMDGEPFTKLDEDSIIQSNKKKFKENWPENRYLFFEEVAPGKTFSNDYAAQLGRYTDVNNNGIPDSQEQIDKNMADSILDAAVNMADTDTNIKKELIDEFSFWLMNVAHKPAYNDGVAKRKKDNDKSDFDPNSYKKV